MPRTGRALFADTSFFYALLATDDRDHVAAVDLANHVEQSALALVTTWDVATETVTLLRYRHSYHAALAFIDEIIPEIHLINISDDVRRTALTHFRTWNRDHRVSLCDCISYVVVTEHLNHTPCLAFDADFERMGLWVLTNPSMGAGWVQEER